MAHSSSIKGEIKVELKTTKLDFCFCAGQFDKIRSIIILKALAQEVEEQQDHLIVTYNEEDDAAIYQFMLLMMEKGVFEYKLYI